MYFCDCCGKECNRLINIFITVEMCPKCYDKWQRGKLGKDEEEEKNEVENDKEGE